MRKKSQAPSAPAIRILRSAPTGPSGPPLYPGTGGEGIVINPLNQGVIQFCSLLPGNMRHDRTPLSFTHQVPHRRHRFFFPTLTGQASFIRNEVELAPSMHDPALLT